MIRTRRRFLEPFKREVLDQVLAGQPLSHLTETHGIVESLLANGGGSTNSMVTMPFRATASSVRKRRAGSAASATGPGYHGAARHFRFPIYARNWGLSVLLSTAMSAPRVSSGSMKGVSWA